MTKQDKVSEAARPPRKDVLFLTLGDLNIEEGFNVRVDMGNIEELAQSIESNGVRVPVRGFKKNGLYIITDGHRRYYAVKMLSERGIDVRIPFITEAGNQASAEQRVFDMLICNEGKKLNPVEESDAISRLINYGFSEDEISTKTGFSKVYVCNLKFLSAAPKKIKNLILENVMKATLAMKILRENKDFDAAIAVIDNAISYAEETKSKKKITDKDVQKSQGKINSYSAVRKAITKADQRTVRIDKIELFNTLKAIHDGEYTLEFLLAELYEPEVEGATAAKKSAKKESKQSAMELKAD